MASHSRDGGRELAVPAWAGAWQWIADIRHQLRVMQCRSAHHRRFVLTCAQLTTARIRSADVEAAELILAMLDDVRLNQGRMRGERTEWSKAELGELRVEARNRVELARIGRDRARIRGPRFDVARIPLERLEALIQRHPNMELVDQLRSERRRRAVLHAAEPVA